MKVSYRREMKHNYMMIDPEEMAWRHYEIQMLESNAIDGVLKFQLRQSNGEIQFYYEITSRQPLGRLLENRTISGEEVRRLVIGISNILDQIERFLLREGSILLKPEYIYVEPDSFRIWLCLVPGLDQDFPEAYGKLLEYILEKVDHQDKDSVVLAYGLYQETRKENYGMEDILRLLQKHADPESEERGRQEGRMDGKEQVVGESVPALSRPIPNVPSPYTPPENKGLWARIKEFFMRRQTKDEKTDPAQLLWQSMFMEEEEERQVLTITEPAAVPLPPVDFTPSGQGTVLLSDFTQKETARVLRSLDKGGEDITLSYYPFIIGKQENMADYILNYETVSRLHVRIDRIGEVYQIMDLNSTNGTMVRGVLLDNNETAALHPGDEIQIARYRFRFE